jgi:hypothetical protein
MLHSGPKRHSGSGYEAVIAKMKIVASLILPGRCAGFLFSSDSHSVTSQKKRAPAGDMREKAARGAGGLAIKLSRANFRSAPSDEPLCPGSNNPFNMPIERSSRCRCGQTSLRPPNEAAFSLGHWFLIRCALSRAMTEHHEISAELYRQNADDCRQRHGSQHGGRKSRLAKNCRKVAKARRRNGPSRPLNLIDHLGVATPATVAMR